MEGFLTTALTWLSQAIMVLSSVWNWFITPVEILGMGEIAPWMILTWASFLVVFTMSLVHLINPLG